MSEKEINRVAWLHAGYILGKVSGGGIESFLEATKIDKKDWDEYLAYMGGNPYTLTPEEVQRAELYFEKRHIRAVDKFQYVTDSISIPPTVAWHGGAQGKYVIHTRKGIHPAEDRYWFTDLDHARSYAGMAAMAKVGDRPTLIKARVQIPRCLTVVGLAVQDYEVFNELADYAKQERFDGLFAIVPEYEYCPIQWCIFDKKHVEVLSVVGA